MARGKEITREPGVYLFQIKEKIFIVLEKVSYIFMTFLNNSWFDVTFSCSLIIAGQFMVAIFCIQCAAVRMNIHSIKQFVQMPVL